MPKERAQSPSSCDDNRESASSLSVYLSNSDDCVHKLRRPRAMKNPSIPIQSTENNLALADGSEEYPILLPGIKKYKGEAIREILVRLPDGSLAAWDISQFNGRKKLVLDNGSLKLVDDLLSDLFAGNICEGTCNDIDAGLGVKMISDACPGKPTVIRYQIVRVPKCCCAESTPLETCTASLYFDDVLADGNIDATTGVVVV